MENKKEGYSFKESTHTHSLDGKKLRGVTTVINRIIAKPALIGWAANVACDHIKDNLDEEGVFKPNVNWEDIIKEARTMHSKKKEKAGDSGSAVHHSIEVYAKTGEMYSGDNPIVQKSFSNFIEWMNLKGAEVLESEKHVYSEALMLGGIVDLVIKINNKKFILDIKTGAKIYPEVFIQEGAYDILLGEEIDGYICLNLCKDGTYEEKRVDDTAVWKECFMACLKLYDVLV